MRRAGEKLRRQWSDDRGICVHCLSCGIPLVGVMTFIVDESGTIYEKDLGTDTAKIAGATTAYDPDFFLACGGVRTVLLTPRKIVRSTGHYSADCHSGICSFLFG